jgi:hypothetical protein
MLFGKWLFPIAINLFRLKQFGDRLLKNCNKAHGLGAKFKGVPKRLPTTGAIDRPV